MPNRISSKRTLEEVVNQDDSDDDDYDDKGPGPSPAKRRTARARTGNRPAKKRRRGGEYNGSDVDSDDDDILEDDSDSFVSDDEPPETNERGRPVRKSAKKAVTYEEGDTSDSDELARSESDDDRPRTPPRRKRQLIVKLKVTPKTASSNPGARRNRSDSHPAHHSSGVAAPRRKSSRLSHDEEEAVVALSSSGRHVEVVRPGSREPEEFVRATRGGKGIKYPSKSTIDEAEEPESMRTKASDDEMEIQPSQHELLDSAPASQAEHHDTVPLLESDLPLMAGNDGDNEGQVIPYAQQTDELQAAQEEEDDEDDGPVSRGRLTRGSTKRKADSPLVGQSPGKRTRLRSKARSTRSGRRAHDESSDFDPDVEAAAELDLSSSGESGGSPRKGSQRHDDDESSNNGRRSNRLRRKAASARASASDTEEELAAEIAELKKDGKKKRASHEEISYEPRGTRRGGKKPNYDLLRNLAPIEDEEEMAAPSPSNRARKPGGGSWQRSLFNTYGPFGGGGNLAPVLGGPSRAQGDVDSDSSDDEVMKQPKPVSAPFGMTPTQPSAGVFNPFAVQPLNNDPMQGAATGTPANLGKIKDKQALADADPLGVDQNVDFDSVGGLQGHIDQLKEMVALPLLYPEIFMRFKITPPRGVLFHGPPGTGKTLLARALASSVSSQGRKVTFYMRKGADALSKWVGEAERQLRLLFEEARKNQPSIIFFDEIDGLAPVRSSKQEQIHASIVSTLLALMDGMDGRGQVIVIGATNRPDSIDPALRRPGRFDREFYFPFPGTEARRAILDIHTKGWNPPLDPMIKDELAELTKGYGGADLRALCTEAALNAVQRRYPQIYKAKEKLLIDPTTIEVTPKDFMISVKKIVPSSERSTSSGASPLPPSIAPLLRKTVSDIEKLLAEVLPRSKKLTALEEAQFEDAADARGFDRERMQQAFETSRVFRPRLLIHGKMGMGQQYVAAALLNHFEGLHVQSFDLATLLSDSTSSPESTVIRLFTEIKMHKPSVIYIPNVQEWYMTVGPQVLSTFFGLLRSIKPSDPILVLGLLEHDQDEIDESIKRELFGYTKRNQYQLQAPTGAERLEFFHPLRDFVQTAPSDFPDPENRKRRPLEILKIAPAEPEKTAPPPSKEELKAQKRRDRQTLNLLKIRLQPIMDQIRMRHKKFRTGVIDENQIRYLYEEADPGTVTSDLHTELRAQASFRPFEVGRDAHGIPGLVDQANDKFYYNLDSVTIEKRLSNGYYKRPKDFLADIKRFAKDAKTIGDDDRLLKAKELVANVEVDIGGIEITDPAFAAECERVYQRELLREKEALEKAQNAGEGQIMPPPEVISNIAHGYSGPSGTTVSDGPIMLGEIMPTAKDMLERLAPVTPLRPTSNSTGMTNGLLQITHGVENGTDPRSNYNESGHEADVEGDTPMHDDDSHHNSNDKSNGTQNTNEKSNGTQNTNEKSNGTQNTNEKSNGTQNTGSSSSFDNRGSAQPRPFHSYTAPSQQTRREAGMSAPLSQTDYMTPMQPGSTAADYQNDASTTQTTSGKKTSGPSTGEKDQQNTQELGPNLYMYDERRSAGGSEIPDTQEKLSQALTTAHAHSQPAGHGSRPHSSQGTNALSRHSQPPVPLFDGSHSQPRTNGHLAEILNPSSPAPNLIRAEQGALDNMILEIADRTSGMSVEQLEQVNSVLMDTLWRTRGDWNRRVVMNMVIEAFNEVTEDMMQVGQEFGESSWGRKDIQLIGRSG